MILILDSDSFSRENPITRPPILPIKCRMIVILVIIIDVRLFILSKDTHTHRGKRAVLTYPLSRSQSFDSRSLFIDTQMEEEREAEREARGSRDKRRRDTDH